MITIDTVFEKGVFRPLEPVAIHENKRIRIKIDSGLYGSSELRHPRLSPGVYPDDFPDVADSDFVYVAVPPKAVHTVSANIIFAGKIEPAPHP